MSLNLIKWYFTSITRDSNLTDKLRWTLRSFYHQSSVLRVFKATYSYRKRREVLKQGCDVIGNRSWDLAHASKAAH